MVIHEHRCADVQRRHQHQALADAAHRYLFGNLIGDVDDLLAPLGLEPEIVGVGRHGQFI